jgi:THO complex subunit 7
MSENGKSIQMNDDEVMKRKLLIDGDGIGDDRRINFALKQFIKWCLTDDETQEDSQLNYERILLTLTQCELSMTKSEQTLKMINEEMKNYETLYKKIDKSIIEAQQKLINCKQELVEAKRIRKNKCEYDSMANVINKHLDRSQTMATLTQLENQIKQLQETKHQIDTKLERRRKQFQVLLGAAHQLQNILNEEESEPNDAILINNEESNLMDTND